MSLEGIIDHGVFKPTYAKPHLITANDAQDYIVKFPAPNECKSIFNEYLGGKIAEHFGLTSLEPEIINLDEEFIKNSADLTSRNISPGDYFATLKMNNSYSLGEENAKRIDLSKIENLSEVPEFIIFDIIFCNNDRNNGNSMLIPIDDVRGKFRYHLIDHGFCFNGPNWNIPAIQNIPNKLGCIPWNTSTITELSQFEVPAEMMTSLTSTDLIKMINMTPIEWRPSKEEIIALTLTLSNRSYDSIMKVIMDNKALFTNWVK